MAAAVAAAPLAHEGDASVRHPAREEVVHVAARELLQPGAVGAAPEDVEHGVVVPLADLGLRAGGAEEYVLAVVRDVGREEAARVALSMK